MGFNKTYKIYLDQIRFPWMSANRVPLYKRLYETDDWEILRSYGEFIRTIITRAEKGEWPMFISFGHDLSNEHTQFFFDNGGWGVAPEPDYESFKEKTGFDAAIWLCNFVWEHNYPFPGYAVHSSNPAGCRNIQQLLDAFMSTYRK